MATHPDMNAYGQMEIVETTEAYQQEFISWLRSQETDADDTSLNDERAVKLSFYEGRPFGNEEEGRSQVVTRDVAEVVDYMTASILRTMISGERVVEFEAMGESDGDAIEQANEAVSQQFMRMQDGYRVLHDTLKAGLLEITGAAKTFMEEEKRRREVEVEEDQLAVMEDEGIEVIAAEPISEAQVDPMTGQLLSPAMWRVAYIESTPTFPDIPIPNEELLVNRDARSLEEAIYVAHVPPTTVSDLRKMGFDVVESDIEFAPDVSGEALAQSREPQEATQNTYRSGVNRYVRFLEEYVRYDLDGDGIAELLRVQRCGNTIFTCTPIDFNLIEEWCPFPMQHRRIGQSLADKCMDIQLVRSVLLRQSLDNLYLSNAPRTLLHSQSMGDTTIDDLLAVRPGGIVRWEGTVAPEIIATPFVAGDSFNALEFMAGERESRTGITRMNQGLDSGALSKTATGQAMMQAAGQQMEEYVARNFAEFISRLFRKKYKLMREFAKPFPIIINGKPTMVNPKQWPEDVRVAVRVGLGTGSRDQRIQNRMMLLSLQEKAAMSDIPITNAMIFESINGLVKDLNLGVATDYWPGPETPEPEKGEQQDPAVIKAQADAQAQAAQLQAKQQETALTLQLKREEAAAKIDLMREEAAARLQLDRERAASEQGLALRQQDFEMAMSREQMDLQREQAEHKASMAENDAVSKKRPGGDLDK